MIFVVAILALMALGGVAFAFAGGDERTQKRVNTFVKSRDGKRAGSRVPEATQKRKSVAVVLKDVEKNQAAMREKNRPTLRRRLEQAGFDGNPRNYWIISGAVGLFTALICLMTNQPKLVLFLAPVGIGLGLPRWTLNFLFARRKKRFTKEFAGAIDVIVRSVKSGLPVNEALRIVARETPDPVGSEFTRLVDGLKVGVTLEQGLKKMHENMPTADVGFFGIVMTIQAKSGGNLSEALSNLAAILRDRKRLEGKIKAMSSEAKASAGIIGSLPPVVTTIVWLTTPDYINMLFDNRIGNLMLLGCGIWMFIGIMVMRGMINFKH